jgi:glycosyltransferase involved in cell wall biosynthesis
MNTITAGPVSKSVPQAQTPCARPIEVLLYSTDFLPGVGGAQQAVAQLARGLLATGNQPTVVTKTPAGTFNDRDLAYRVVRNPGFTHLWRLMGEADMVHLAGPAFIALMIGLLRRKTIVIEHHGYQAICPNGLLLYAPRQAACPGHFLAGQYAECVRCVATANGWLSGIWQLLLMFPRRWMCRRVSANAAVSQHVERRLQLPRSHTVYHGVPDLCGEAISLGSSSSPPVCFGFVGRLVEEKGLIVLLDAACQIRKRGYDFRLKFIGDGPQRARLEELVRQNDLSSQVIFMGSLNGEAFRRATADVAAVIVPSIMEETAGLAAIEQMMRGRLVIASDIGGLGEVVGETGLKFSTGNAEQLASCMERVLEQPGIVNEMGARARQRSLKLFSEPSMIEVYLDLYREVLG